MSDSVRPHRWQLKFHVDIFIYSENVNEELHSFTSPLCLYIELRKKKIAYLLFNSDLYVERIYSAIAV